MASNVTAADHVGAVPVTAISCPDAGNKLTVAYHRQAVAALLANDALATTNISGKVAKAGDTMTGKLDINQGTTNTNALEADGNGTGAGAVLTGGSNGKGAEISAGGGNNIGAYCAGAGTGSGVQALGGASGKGGEFFAGGGNAAGLAATGNGSGSGISCTGGSTGPGIVAAPGTAQTNTSPACAGIFAGYIQLTGTDPNKRVDPGADNVLHAMSICKMWVTVSVAPGGGPFTPADSYNVDTVVEVSTGVYDITFKRAMSSASYAAVFAVNAIGLIACTTTRSTTVLRFTLYDSATQLASGNAVAIHAVVFSRQ
jgi:hypothetical protein